MSNRRSYLILLSGALLWCLLLVVPPIMAALVGPSNIVSGQIYKFFSPVCHQYEARSLHVSGYKIAVCARCFGIYSGFLLGIILITFMGRLRRMPTIVWWIIALIPMCMDVVLDAVGLHGCTLVSRTLTGLFFGMIAAWLLAPHMIDGISALIDRKLIHHGEYNELKA